MPKDVTGPLNLEDQPANEILHARQHKSAPESLIVGEIVDDLHTQHNPRGKTRVHCAFRRRQHQTGDLFNDTLLARRMRKSAQLMASPDDLFHADKKEIAIAMALHLTRKRLMPHQQPIRKCKETANIIPYFGNSYKQKRRFLQHD